MEDYQNDEVICPACKNSMNIEKISDDEKNYGMGLYANFDFVGAINKITHEYRCNNCGFEW